MFSVQFSVYDNEGSQYKKEEFTDQELDTEKDNWGFGTFLKHDEILHNGLLKDGRFKLFAKVWVGQKGEERTVTNVVKPDEEEESISKKIMNKLLTQDIFLFINLIYDSSERTTHKRLL